MKSLAQFEREVPLYPIDWDEAHDFLDYIVAGLERNYGDCDEMEDVRHAVKALQAELLSLED